MAEPSFQQQAYDYLKAQITMLKLKPSQQISDSQIAQEMGISRTPVREAFYRLENEGLLLKESRGNWRVYSLSLDDIHHIFDIKMVLEGMLAHNAADCQDKQLRQALQDAVDQMAAAAEANDPDAWLAADFNLHDVLFEMAGNERAQRIVANLNDQWHRVRIGYVAMQARITESTREHQEIVDSILSGDGESAQRQMQDHLNNVRDELARLLTNLVLPFAEQGV